MGRLMALWDPLGMGHWTERSIPAYGPIFPTINAVAPQVRHAVGPKNPHKSPYCGRTEHRQGSYLAENPLKKCRNF